MTPAYLMKSLRPKWRSVPNRSITLHPLFGSPVDRRIMPPSPCGWKPREAVLLRATRALLLFLVLSACADDGTPVPPVLPADALPGMESEDTVVDAGVLARDALDPEALDRLLDDAGFVSGRGRTFSGPGERFSLAVTRVLVFASPDGAASYVGWLREHPKGLLGSAEPLAPLELPGDPFLLVHTPGGCCPKAVPIYLSAWQRGSSVLFVRVSGRGADPSSVQQLAAELDLVVTANVDA